MKKLLTLVLVGLLLTMPVAQAQNSAQTTYDDCNDGMRTETYWAWTPVRMPLTSIVLLVWLPHERQVPC